MSEIDIVMAGCFVSLALGWLVSVLLIGNELRRRRPSQQPIGRFSLPARAPRRLSNG